MRRSIFFFVLLSLWILIPSVAADGTWSVDLVAGQDTTIGRVIFMINGDALTARYQITVDGWCMKTTHLYVDNTAPAHHAPGQFTYSHERNDCVVEDMYNVPTPDGDVFVAAHADTYYSPTNQTETVDPFSGMISLVALAGADSYLTATVSGALVGTYAAWCVDLDHLIYTGLTYTANIYDSTAGADGLVDYSANIDLVNYILNQDYVSQGYSVLAVQSAIWSLIDDTPSPYGLQIGTDVIIADALANGAGFVPGCGDVMGIIIEPIEGNAQHLVLEYPVPCSQDSSDQQARSETAWTIADWGIPFDQAWGMYFQLVDADTQTSSSDDSTIGEDPSDNTGDSGTTGNESSAQENPEPPRGRSAEAPGQNRDNSPPGGRKDDAPGQNK